MPYIRIVVTLVLAGALAFGASPSIGLARANGAFQLDNSKVYGNATLFDGSLIQTSTASSDLVLQSGARLRLGADSQARVHSDRLVLEKGQSEVSAVPGYSIEALGLRAAPGSPQSRIVVTYSGPARIQVAALIGSARVSGANGVLVANVPAGSALELEPQVAGASTPSKITGRVESKNGAILLPDETSRVTFTLLGADLDRYIHKCVEATGNIDSGTPAAAGSTQVLRVLAIQELSCPKPAGMATHSRAIIGGVALVAVTVGATAGVLASRSSSETISQ